MNGNEPIPSQDSDNPDISGSNAPDSYWVSDEFQTPAEQLEPESLEERLGREIPEDAPFNVPRVGHLVEPESELGQLDVTSEAIALDAGFDGDLTSEEAAMHIEEV